MNAIEQYKEKMIIQQDRGISTDLTFELGLLTALDMIWRSLDEIAESLRTFSDTKVQEGK